MGLNADMAARDLLLVPVMRWHRNQWNRRVEAGKMPGLFLALVYSLLMR